MQTFTCPHWAIDCQVPSSVQWIQDRGLSTIQGIMSTIHGIGLAILAYPAFILAEAALWPILTHESYTLSSVDMYLSATRGSVPGLIQSVFNVGRRRASVVMIFVGIITLSLQADRIVVGQAYSLGNVTKTYHSTYMAGGGIGLSFGQEFPPGRTPAPAFSASSFFTSWSKNLSNEPLPEFRDFIVNRMTLVSLGGITITGLKASKTIACAGQSLNISDGSAEDLFQVAANFPKAKSSIRLRMQPRLAVWVDKVQYESQNRTITTLVFAAINGTIENGISTPATKHMESQKYESVSGLKCTVDVTLNQSTINIGDGPDNGMANVSSTQTVIGPGKHNSKFGALGDVAEWMGTVVTTLGISVRGAQPLFDHNTNALPTPFTTTQGAQAPQNWLQADLLNFISVASGALALSMSTEWNRVNTTLRSSMTVQQIIPMRSLILLIPASVVLLAEVFLAVLLFYTYRRARIPEMRQAKTSDIIFMTQNQSIKEGVAKFSLHSGGHKQLELLKVRYGILEEEPREMGLSWAKGDDQDIQLKIFGPRST